MLRLIRTNMTIYTRRVERMDRFRDAIDPLLSQLCVHRQRQHLTRQPLRYRAVTDRRGSRLTLVQGVRVEWSISESDCRVIDVPGCSWVKKPLPRATDHTRVLRVLDASFLGNECNNVRNR